jgi:phage repressor protein C with HTH and peptisase S24 domain
MGDEKPYAWCKKVGIEKGLFQYYWQKGKIPKYENLVKIRNHSGCSLDWLMTGEGEAFPDRIENVVGATYGLLEELSEQITAMESHVDRLKKLRGEIERFD